MPVREVLPDGTVRLSSPTCTFVFNTVRPGVLLMTVSGRDTGEFGTAALDEIDSEIRKFGPLDLFVDAREATMVAVRVSDAWTEWFRLNSRGLRRVNTLVSSKAMDLTMGIAKHFSQTGDMIRSYNSKEEFEKELARSAGRTVTLS